MIYVRLTDVKEHRKLANPIKSVDTSRTTTPSMFVKEKIFFISTFFFIFNYLDFKFHLTNYLRIVNIKCRNQIDN